MLKLYYRIILTYGYEVAPVFYYDIVIVKYSTISRTNFRKSSVDNIIQSNQINNTRLSITPLFIHIFWFSQLGCQKLYACKVRSEQIFDFRLSGLTKSC